MLGQHDRASVLPFRARTKWGLTASAPSALSVKCVMVTTADSHTNRSWDPTPLGPVPPRRQKHPTRCSKWLRAIPVELSDCSAAQAWPAVMAAEEVEEAGLLDDPDELDQPTIGRNIGDGAELEQELLDILKLDDFQEHKQERRAAWLNLPRNTRAILRCFRIMLATSRKHL